MAGQADTIYALASGSPPAALAVVRISGPGTTQIADRLLGKGCPPPREVVYDRLYDPSGHTIDQGLAWFLPGPGNYTGEDTLEVSVHGGRHIVDRLLKALNAYGARLAEPGEYTRRAFEAGKLDLTQAEAVADLIEAESQGQHAQAIAQLEGSLSKQYSAWQSDFTKSLALLSAAIDFPDEEDAPGTVTAPVLEKLHALLVEFDEALSAGDITQRIRDGFRIAIVGPPNAGKSTLLNRFAGREAAIVTDIPGTTRDVVEVRLVIGRHLVWLSDTAGLRETSDPVEKIGVEKARQTYASADVRLWVEAGDTLTLPSEPGSDRDIHIRNKADLMDDAARNVSRETLLMSAATGQGFDTLTAAIEARLDDLAGSVPGAAITRARHRDGIKAARARIESAVSHLQSGLGDEFAAEDVRSASQALSSLIGHIDVEDILGSVFSSFCIGK